MTGHGGWPLNVFLTPEQLPFYGGTYFPPEPRHGMPAWTQVLQAIGEAWSRATRGDPRRRRGPARAPVRRRAAEALLRAARREDALDDGRRETASEHSTRATADSEARARSSRRRRRSSFCCCRRRARRWRCTRCARWPAAASTTRWAAGSRATASMRPGRCRTSRRCSTTTPCSRAPTCTGCSCSGEPRLEEVCRDTLDWALREMRGPEGGFYSRARRRLRGRRGTLLRVDGRRAARRARRRRGRGDRVVRRDRAGQLRRPPPSRAGPERAARIVGRNRPDEAAQARFAPACWRCANAACAPDWTTSG